MSVSSSEIAKCDLEFDEGWYVEMYPDVGKAVKDGVVRSALAHYVDFGRDEGRLPTPFAPEWYARTYSGAVDEAGSADRSALYQHYLDVGRFRGYRPHEGAARPKNAARIPSEFGGLWIDHANAADLVAGKYEIGQINRSEANLLNSYAKNGYVKLSGVIPTEIIDRAEAALENAYAGKIDNLLFECHALSPAHCPWLPGVKDHPAKALDFHWWSEDIRNLVLDTAVTHFLQLLFERRALVSQTLGFYRGSAQPLHQDSAYVTYSLPLQFTASWIALEDVSAGAGELEYLVGSHKELPEYTYPGGYKSVRESERYTTDKVAIANALEAHVNQIATEGQQRAMKREKFHAKRGDVLFWHSDLAHGGSPISLRHSRKSVVSHYCPAEVAPLYFEDVPATVRRHGLSGFYSSGIYGGMRGA
jgi:Phytanoyl-CoA dioxygenase (PhyH)